MISIKSTALMVIDVQLGLFTGKTPIYNEEELLHNINTLIDAARKTNMLVFFIQHANDNILQKRTEGYQYHPDIHLKKDDHIFYQPVRDFRV